MTPNGGLKQVTPRKRIRPISYKLEVQRRIYRQRAKDFLARHPICAVTGQPSTQTHHSRGRRGNLLLDERWWVPVNAQGHDFIGREPDKSRKLMWNGIPVLAAMGDWGKEN